MKYNVDSSGKEGCLQLSGFVGGTGGGGAVGKCVKSDANNEKQSKRVYMR